MALNAHYITVGVLIPTYNRLDYLKVALGSVLNQSYVDLAIIVIDNGSTDGTADYMASLLDSRLKYVVNDQNLGLIGSINRGINLMPAGAVWCTVLCDDDYLDREWVCLMVERLNESSALSVVQSHRTFVDEHGKHLQEARPQPGEETGVEYLSGRCQHLRETYLTGVLFSRQAFTAIGGYPTFMTGLLSDDAFIFALSLQDRLVSASAATAFIRIHAGAESRISTDGIAKLETIEEFCLYCLELLQKQGTQVKELSRGNLILDQYGRELFSFWWLNTAHAFYASPSLDKTQMDILLDMVEQHPERYLLRVRAAATCLRRYGFCPEGYRWYQQICSGLKWLIRPLRKVMTRK